MVHCVASWSGYASTVVQACGTLGRGRGGFYGGAGPTGSVRGVCGVVWYDDRRVSAVEGTAAHPLFRCSATSGPRLLAPAFRHHRYGGSIADRPDQRSRDLIDIRLCRLKVPCPRCQLRCLLFSLSSVLSVTTNPSAGPGSGSRAGASPSEFGGRGGQTPRRRPRGPLRHHPLHTPSLSLSPLHPLPLEGDEGSGACERFYRAGRAAGDERFRGGSRHLRGVVWER